MDKQIKTWQERAEEGPFGSAYLSFKCDAYMLAEILDLRAALAAQPAPSAQGPIWTADDEREQAHLDSLAQDDLAALVAQPAPLGAAGGPGTPIARLAWLLEELSKRFPNSIGRFSSASREEAFLKAIDAQRATVAAVEAQGPSLTVWSGSMPESNGKSNFTAILHRKGAEGSDKFEGFTIARSEYPDRVRYEADRVRYLIGEIAKRPHILDYDADKHSGYVAPIAEAPQASEDAARLEFLMERGAWIAWSKDGESCRLFHRNKDDGEPMPMLGWGARHWSHDPREAIDAARSAK